MIDIVDSLGETRFLMPLESMKVTKAFKVFGDDAGTPPLIHRDQWKPVSLRPFSPPIKDQDGIGACFPPGTMIRMADGSERPIENVKLLDQVLTAEGNISRVIRTIVREESSHVCRLNVWGNRLLRATSEHPILTKRGYVPVSEIQCGDMVAMPRYAPKSATMIQTGEYTSRRIYSTRAKQVRHIAIPGKPEAVIIRHQPPDVIELTPEFGRIIGLYLAEGCTDKGKVNWAFGAHEEFTLATELVGLLQKVFGAEANIRHRRGGSCVVVTMYGTWWAQLFETWCAKGCDGKTLHPDLAAGPTDFLESVLNGWTDGDGLGPDNEGGVTVSKSLAMCMYDAANALGYRPTIEWLDVKVNPKHNIKQRRRRYLVRWRGNKGERPDDWRSEQTDSHVYRKVAGVVEESYQGWVFNLEVEGDNSYVAEGIGVHNCNAFATVTATEVARAMAGLAYVPLSTGYLYGAINQQRDQGSLLEDAIEWMMKNGTCLANTVGMLDWQKSKWPSTAAAEAKQYRVLEYYWTPTFDHFASAIQQGFAGNIGIMWGSSDNPNSNGYLPDSAGGRAGGHAIAVDGLVNDGGKWGLELPNSWSTKWGWDNGRFKLSETRCKNEAGNFGWFVVRCTTFPSDQGVPQPK